MEKCLINPANPQSRLSALHSSGKTSEEKTESEKERPADRLKWTEKGMKTGKRATMRHAGSKTARTPDVMRAHSGTTSHVTGKKNHVFNKK